MSVSSVLLLFLLCISMKKKNMYLIKNKLLPPPPRNIKPLFSLLFWGGGGRGVELCCFSSFFMSVCIFLQNKYTCTSFYTTNFKGNLKQATTGTEIAQRLQVYACGKGKWCGSGRGLSVIRDWVVFRGVISEVVKLRTWFRDWNRRVTREYSFQRTWFREQYLDM